MPRILTDLPEEILLIILEHLSDASPRTVRGIRTANKVLSTTARTVLNRQRTFTYHEDKSMEYWIDKQPWILREDVLDNLRHLTIRHPQNCGPSHDYCHDKLTILLEPIAKIIARIKNLKSLTWNTQNVTVSLLESLHKHHPAAELRIFELTRFDIGLDHLDAAELALSSYPTLTHFKTSPRYRMYNSVHRSNYVFTAFNNIVARSRSLKYAGLVLPPFGSSLSDFPKPDQSRCSSLRSLTLDGSHLRLTKETLQILEQHIDISQLENLKFSRGFPDVTYFQNAATMLPNLRHVSLNCGTLRDRRATGVGDPLCQAAEEYLVSGGPFQTLSLWAWTRVISLEQIISRHGHVLESLQLHEKDPGLTYEELPPISAITVPQPLETKSLAERCHCLRELTIDMKYEGHEFDLTKESTIMESLTHIASFKPHLDKLQICFPIDQRFENFLDLGLASELGRSNSNFMLESGITEEKDTEYEPTKDTEIEGGRFEDARVEAVQTRDRETEPEGVETKGPGNEDDFGQLTDATEPRTRFINDIAPGPELVPDALDCAVVLKVFAKKMWKVVYGNAKTGERLLTVKFGEWSGSPSELMFSLRRYLEVRPHERDDMDGECTVKMRRSHIPTE